MAQGQSTEIISMIKWIRTSRWSMKNSLSEGSTHGHTTQEPWRGLLKDNFPAKQWFLKVEIVFKDAFE